ncbi:MAG: metal-sulfur cluster assembly factor [archaeon]
MVDKETVEKALRKVMDPELGMEIVSLGLIYGITVDDGNVHVLMTFTTPGCPYGPVLVDDARNRIVELDGVKDAKVEVTFSPPWQAPADLRALYGL